MNARSKQRRIGFMSFGVLALIFGAVFYMLMNLATGAAVAEPVTESPRAGPSFDFPLISKYVADLVDTGYLTLVNRQHPISAEPDSLSPAWPTVAVSRTDGMYLHPSALRAVSQMFASARSAGIDGLHVSSGFRGHEAQARLYDNGANSAFALPPGHSEHHTGLGVDIMATGISQRDLGNSRQGRWMANNAYRYGLILRYPKGAEDITGITFEPWHFRYVGTVHAYFMHHNNLVLEEYLQLIRDRGEIAVDKNGTVYYVLFQPERDGMIDLPPDLNFNVSNDNKGGYVVTAWR